MRNRPEWDDYFLEMAVSVASRAERLTGAVLVAPDHRVVSIGKCSAHAERDAILCAVRSRLAGATVYSTRPPCMECLTLIKESGIVRVVFPEGSMNAPYEFDRGIFMA
jgi:deoxycytidylate deaminase